ncbi:MAG: FtsW/RodA/SpoVE family cell cycle protein [Gammaproteobacteria bacterium AqS3]|nr:FtsW/RodA/SpoVE family cell cycle protein [Gammaproteobacteria bacterium AqS3]
MSAPGSSAGWVPLAPGRIGARAWLDIWQGQLLIGVAAVLILLGWLLLTGYDPDVQGFAQGFDRQGVKIAAAFALGLAVYAVMPWLSRIKKPPLIDGAVVLAGLTALAVGIYGDDYGKGAPRWVNWGGQSLQPSEFIKLMVVFLMAFYCTWMQPTIARTGIAKNGEMLLLFGRIGLIALVILAFLKQSIGIVLILLGTVLGQLMLAGLTGKRILFLSASVVPAALATLLAYTPGYIDQRLRDWYSGLTGEVSGYQIDQALMTAYSGWFGTGIGNGVQKYYIPDATSDFMFSVISEELGALGACLVLAALLIMSWLILRIGRRAEEHGANFNAYLCYGFGLLFLAQVVLNIGSNLALFPVNGTILPLISHGGSSLAANVAGLAGVFWVHHQIVKLHRVQNR